MAARLIGARYQQISEIGEGGMQKVFLSEDRSLGRKVALKIPTTPSAQRRFDRSARLSAKVVHPNVAATLDYVRDNGNEYLIEEYIPGEDLQKRFQRDFISVDAHLAAHVVHHLAKGVAAAHHAGVVHRDLKPSNIMVSSDGNLASVKITDFGIAKMASSVLASEVEKMNRDSSTITGSKTLVGAIPYMAPEALTDSSAAAFPADIWAIGAIAYWLVSGVPPFGVGLPAVAKILGTEPIPKPSFFGRIASLSSVEASLSEIISICMDRDPAKRPTADALVSKMATVSYSTAPRLEGVVVQIGFGGNRSACTIEAGGRRYFFHSGASFYNNGQKLEHLKRVSFTAFEGLPNPRAGIVLPLRDTE